MFDELNISVADMNKQLESIKETYRSKLAEAFREGIKNFFLTFPEIQAIVWEQYTPYFNDGEECIFSVHEPVFVTKGFDTENLETCSYGYEDEESYETLYIPYDGGDTAILNACHSLESTLANMEDYLKDTFGDHAIVYVTPDCIIVNEKYHN